MDLTRSIAPARSVMPMPATPLVIELRDRRLWVVALTDLDGTVNDETQPEAARLDSIGPARSALAELERWGIAVGIVTGRSFGEAALYHACLEISGPIICEDGAVLGWPRSAERYLSPADRRDAYSVRPDGWYRVLSGAPRGRIAAFLRDFSERADLPNGLLTTLEPRWAELQAYMGHATLEATQRAADRLASVLVCLPEKGPVAQLTAAASEWDLRVFGEPLHVLGRGADKGTALQHLATEARLPSDVDGILPIVFGNGPNDLALFAQAERLGGIGVLIAHPSGGFFVPEAAIPPTVLRASRPFGHGMAELLPQLHRLLHARLR